LLKYRLYTHRQQNVLWPVSVISQFLCKQVRHVCSSATLLLQLRVLGDRRVSFELRQQRQERQQFVHRFLTDSQKEKLRAQAKEKGQQLIEMGPGDPVRAEVHIGGT
jgi:hypothetical protein